MTTVLQIASTTVLSLVMILFCVALLVELVEYEEIAKVLVIPMLSIGIIVSGYGVFKSL